LSEKFEIPKDYSEIIRNLSQEIELEETEKAQKTLTNLENQIAGGHPNLKDGVCKGRPPLSWNCLVFYDKTSLT
jgi:hypothetical protein